MTNRPQSLPVLFLLGALGPLAGWADATRAAPSRTAPGAALQTSVKSIQKGVEVCGQTSS